MGKKSQIKQLGPGTQMTGAELSKIISGEIDISISAESKKNLDECRLFVESLLDADVKVYGITTGVGDLRKVRISAEAAANLSAHIIRSHDAGIGNPISQEITLGAMILTCSSLSKGYSGFSYDSLSTLVGMIQNKIVPIVPSSGSLGASGDLAFLARLGRAMMGDSVDVWYKGKRLSANQALKEAGVSPMQPKAKEGLALINGTSFMASMLSAAYDLEVILLESLMALEGIFLNATQAVAAAFRPEVHEVRNQKGQIQVAKILRQFFINSSAPENEDFQNDYCIRCIPQIFGPRIELILEQRGKLESELNAITDNPLFFSKCDSVSETDGYPFEFNGKRWGVFAGGNFHGENLTAIADILAISNAKIAITLERQIAYLLNPSRNGKKLPCYLIPNAQDLGLKSGFMIPHYTSNALVHKICLLAQPSSLMNATSSNESEDVVSYGATACQKLLKQLEYFKELLTVFSLTVCQAYAIKREEIGSKNPQAEEIFSGFQRILQFPIGCEQGFTDKYESVAPLVLSGELGSAIGNPFRVFSKRSKSKNMKVNYANS